MTIKTRNIADGAVTAAKIASGAVTAAKLATTLMTGYIPLDISMVRIIAANVIQDTTEGGVPDGNTAPSFQRINGATDKAGRLIWAAGSSVEVTFPPVALPPDIDSTADLTVKLRVQMAAGGMDTPTIAVSYFEGVGDTNAGGATGAASVTLSTLSRAIAAADVGAAGAAFTVGLTPGTHANEALWLFGAWVEYTRA